MKNMKRFAALWMAGTMILSTNVYAEEEVSKEGKKVIQWLATYYDQNAVTKYVDMYNAQQDEVYVEVVDATFANSNEYYENLAINIASEDPYDIFLTSPAYFNKYVASGTAYCLDEYILENDDVKDYAKEIVTRGDHAYAYPASSDIIGLYVNVEMLEGAGHTLDDLGTWDGLMQAAADISNTYGNYGFLTNLEFGGGYAEYLWYSIMWGEGGDISADVDGNITVTNPEKVAKAAKMYHDMVTSDGGSTELDNSYDYLVNGTCGMLISGQSGLYQLDDELGADFEWTFREIPTSETDGQSYATLGGWSVMVNAEGEYVQESLDFMNWMWFESDFMVEQCLGWYALSPLVSADEKLDPLYKETKYSLAYDLIESGEMACKGELAFESDTFEALSKMLSSVVFESETDEDALACVQTFIDTVDAAIVEE